MAAMDALIAKHWDDIAGDLRSFEAMYPGWLLALGTAPRPR